MAKLYNPDSSNSWGFSYDFATAKPMDTRAVVDTYNSLLLPATWLKGSEYMHYKGMTVSCADTGKVYTYIGKSGDITDVTNDSNWKTSELSASGLSSEYTLGKFLSFADTNALQAYKETIKAGTYVYVEERGEYYKVAQNSSGSGVADELNQGHAEALPDSYSAQGNYVIADKYKDVIFYCTDTEGEHKGKIYLNGLPYGGEDLKVGDGLTYNANKELTLTPASGGKLGGIIATQEDKKDDNNFNVSVQQTGTPGAAYVHIPNASKINNGLMTTEQVNALGKATTDINSLETKKANKTELEQEVTNRKAAITALNNDIQPSLQNLSNESQLIKELFGSESIDLQYNESKTYEIGDIVRGTLVDNVDGLYVKTDSGWQETTIVDEYLKLRYPTEQNNLVIINVKCNNTEGSIIGATVNVTDEENGDKYIDSYTITEADIKSNGGAYIEVKVPKGSLIKIECGDLAENYTTPDVLVLRSNLSTQTIPMIYRLWMEGFYVWAYGIEPGKTSCIPIANWDTLNNANAEFLLWSYTDGSETYQFAIPLFGWDMNTYAHWAPKLESSSAYITVPETSTALGTGVQNTKAIVDTIKGAMEKARNENVKVSPDTVGAYTDAYEWNANENAAAKCYNTIFSCHDINGNEVKYRGYFPSRDELKLLFPSWPTENTKNQTLLKINSYLGMFGCEPFFVQEEFQPRPTTESTPYLIISSSDGEQNIEWYNGAQFGIVGGSKWGTYKRTTSSGYLMGCDKQRKGRTYCFIDITNPINYE